MLISKQTEVNPMQQAANIKTSVHELIDQLPENVSWSELAYHIEVRASIERGIEDADAGRTYTTEEVKKRLGLIK